MLTSVFILYLAYDHTFNDADDGWCYAGEGLHPLLAFTDENEARKFGEQFSDVVDRASKVTRVFPVHEDNAKLKEVFGFTLHDLPDHWNPRFEVHEVSMFNT